MYKQILVYTKTCSFFPSNFVLPIRIYKKKKYLNIDLFFITTIIKIIP